MTKDILQRTVADYMRDNRGRLVEMISDLVRIPSENTPPVGQERACQLYLADALRKIGWAPELYEMESVPGLTCHPLFWKGRDYTGRPNLGARRKGGGGGRSLVLSGHIDTVPVGTLPWTRDPFGAEIDDGRLFGRGANDMKAGVATNLFVADALHRLGIELCGDLVFEAVVDEEFGGSNGTLAGRLAGFNGDAAIVSEPSFLRICAGQRGGRVAHVTLHCPAEGILDESGLGGGVAAQLQHLLSKLDDFGRTRRLRAGSHPLWARHADPVPVSVTKISTGPWGTKEPIAVPGNCQIEIYWQTLPGETQADIDRQFLDWLNAVVDSAPLPFQCKPEVCFPTRFLPASETPISDPLVLTLAESATTALGTPPPVEGIEGPGDMFLFQQTFGIPAVYWGARGANTHAPDEYVDIQSAIDAAHTLLLFVCTWCGTD